MIELENSGIDDEEEIMESPKLVFKFAFQTETFARLSREGYKSVSDSGECESKISFLSSSPAVSTAVDKYETPSLAKILTFLVDNPKAANFRAEESFKNDFLESDSDFFDSSQTFTSENEFLSDSDYGETSPEEKGQNRKNKISGSDSEEDEDTNEFESLWEHQDLIEQLKMEMKKVKAIGGLPTIPEEEDQCPKIMENLKPWRIEEDKKFKHVDTIGEVHKFHKSYRERMRKLDILSFQKSYALELLQSKNPQQAISTVRSSPSKASIFPVNFRLWKPKKSETEPMVQFIKEINGELENVYVGQMCLSWEILHWQYEKAIEFHESDIYSSRRYNEVAGEFQQFQVLLQRFLENEPFEEPRIQHYIKRRRLLRNLLQVPVIREDRNKDKSKVRRRDKEENDDNSIKSDQLVEFMEDTIRLFWRFVRFDKFTNSIHDQKSQTKSQIKPDSEDLEMFTGVKSELEKKEKKLKDLLRSEKCIIRRFQKKQKEEEEDEVLYFFSEVDMKLVTRVLKMSKLNKEHLVWCHNKLTKISFFNRKLHLDHSFCLFPC